MFDLFPGGLTFQIFLFHCLGDPTVFGNLEPCYEMIDAVVKCVKQSKHNGYAPSTGFYKSAIFFFNLPFEKCKSGEWSLKK